MSPDVALPPALGDGSARANPLRPGSAFANRQRLVTTLAISGAVTAPFAGHPLGMLAAALLTSAALAGLLAGDTRDHLSVVAFIPAAFAMLVGVFAGLGTVLWLLGIPLWSSRLGAVASLILVLVVIVVLSRRRSRQVLAVGPDWPALGVLMAMLASGVVIALVQPFEVWSRTTSLGTDFTRHLIAVSDLVDEGYLSYASSSYPRGLHAWLGVLWSGGGEGDFATAWASFTGAAWLMTALIVTALVVVASRLLRRFHLSIWWSAVFAPLVIMIGFLHSMWISSMLVGGFLTSLLAGLILASALVLPLGPKGLSSRPVLLSLVLLSLAMVNAWTILVPPVALVTLVALIIGLKQRQVPVWSLVVTLGCGGLALIPLWALVSPMTSASGVSESLNTGGNSGLWLPQWWWLLFAGLSVLGAAIAYRASLQAWALAWSLLAVSGLAILIGVAATTGASAASVSYYALKTGWTLSVLIIPGAVAAAAWLLQRGGQLVLAQPAGPIRLATLSVFASILVLVGATVAGRLLGNSSTLVQGARYGLGNLPFQIPAVTAVEQAKATGQVRITEGDPVLVFGIAPYGTAALMSSVPNFQDLLAQEAMRWVRLDAIAAAGLRNQILLRDTEALCTYLRDNPEAVRVTGPNPATGLEWLIASGCPAEVVNGQPWIAASIPEDWFRHYPWYQQPYQYPTYQEYVAERTKLGLETSQE